MVALAFRLVQVRQLHPSEDHAWEASMARVHAFPDRSLGTPPAGPGTCAQTARVAVPLGGGKAAPPPPGGLEDRLPLPGVPRGTLEGRVRRAGCRRSADEQAPFGVQPATRAVPPIRVVKGGTPQTAPLRLTCDFRHHGPRGPFR